MTTNYEPTYIEALHAWLRDATSDDPSLTVRQWPLCVYLYFHVQRHVDHGDEYLRAFAAFVRSRVERAGPFPFPFGEDAYRRDNRNDTFHTDPNRLAFVRAELERLDLA